MQFRKPCDQEKCTNRGFTLVELLVVVTIISILAAIAVPNMLDAQTRARVSRTMADMRTMITAIESYQVDNDEYPNRHHPLNSQTTFNQAPPIAQRAEQLRVLTTPVAYLTLLPEDVFEKNVTRPLNIIDYYDANQFASMINTTWNFISSKRVKPDEMGYLLVSVGPDGYLGDWDGSSRAPRNRALDGSILNAYDPTNGTISPGNIYAGQIKGLEGMGDFILSKRRH